jgi:hypothetical protein
LNKYVVFSFRFMKSIFLFGLLFLSACGVFSKYGSLTPYGNGLHSTYAQYLTEEEINELNSKGEIYKEYNYIGRGDTTFGDLRITRTAKAGVFNFIEIGQWYEKFSYAGELQKKGDMRRLTIYDSLGNITERLTYNKPRKNDDYFLYEEWKLSKAVIDGVDAYTLKIILYYPNESISWDGNYLVKDFSVLNSNRLKKHIPIDTIKQYDEAGKLKADWVYDNNGVLLKKLKYKTE